MLHICIYVFDCFASFLYICKIKQIHICVPINVHVHT